MIKNEYQKIEQKFFLTLSDNQKIIYQNLMNELFMLRKNIKVKIKKSDREIIDFKFFLNNSNYYYDDDNKNLSIFKESINFTKITQTDENIKELMRILKVVLKNYKGLK